MDNALEIKKAEELVKIDKHLDKVLELRKAVKDASTMEEYSVAIRIFNSSK